jgi:hypothetical protein
VTQGKAGEPLATGRQPLSSWKFGSRCERQNEEVPRPTSYLRSAPWKLTRQSGAPRRKSSFSFWAPEHRVRDKTGCIIVLVPGRAASFQYNYTYKVHFVFITCLHPNAPRPFVQPLNRAPLAEKVPIPTVEK